MTRKASGYAPPRPTLKYRQRSLSELFALAERCSTLNEGHEILAATLKVAQPKRDSAAAWCILSTVADRLGYPLGGDAFPQLDSPGCDA